MKFTPGSDDKKSLQSQIQSMLIFEKGWCLKSRRGCLNDTFTYHPFPWSVQVPDVSYMWIHSPYLEDHSM